MVMNCKKASLDLLVSCRIVSRAFPSLNDQWEDLRIHIKLYDVIESTLVIIVDIRILGFTYNLVNLKDVGKCRLIDAVIYGLCEFTS